MSIEWKVPTFKKGGFQSSPPLLTIIRNSRVEGGGGCYENFCNFFFFSWLRIVTYKNYSCSQQLSFNCCSEIYIQYDIQLDSEKCTGRYFKVNSIDRLNRFCGNICINRTLRDTRTWRLRYTFLNYPVHERCHENGSFSAYSFNQCFLSVLQYTGSWWSRFQETYGII